MKILLILVSFLTVHCFAISQNNSDLDKKNGFQGIYLNSPLSLYESFIPVKEYLSKLSPTEFYKQEYQVDFYDYIYTGSNHSSIGDFKVKHLVVDVYKGRIHKIKVICECNQDLLNTILIKYGEPKFDLEDKKFEDGKSHYYNAYWDGEKVHLSLIYKKYYNPSYSYNSKIPDLISLEYSSVIINKQIEEDKEEKALNKIRKAYNDF